MIIIKCPPCLYLHKLETIIFTPYYPLIIYITNMPISMCPP